MHTSNPNVEPEFIARLEQSLAEDTFVRLRLSGPASAAAAFHQVTGRLIVLHGAPHLSFTLTGTRHETRNLPVPEAIRWVGGQLHGAFQNALLSTTRKDWQLRRPAKGPARLIVHRATQAAPPPRTHDLPRQRLLDATACDWLQGLEILDPQGNVRARMADKHRQIDRYLEILSHLAEDCGWATPSQPGERDLVLADMGCGKGYLTFGLWHLFHRVWHRYAHIIGVELRPELTAKTTALAQQVKAAGLDFVAGTIETVKLPRLDGLIALHACNTATDDALLRGIDLGARLIVVAPCCHQQLRPQLGRPEPLAAVLRHGLMAERMAEWATDGLRALFLDWAGYETKVIEFVGSEHTPKNLMLAAVRQREPYADTAARERILAFKQFFAIQTHALDALLQRPLPPQDAS
ncbi:MAG: SAM-dependent methyltransferase [Verrucomicrobiota bacterium]